jgi:hypothetical protein
LLDRDAPARERIRNDVLRHRIGVKRVYDGSEEQYRELPFYLPAVFVREPYPSIDLGDIQDIPLSVEGEV